MGRSSGEETRTWRTPAESRGDLVPSAILALLGTQGPTSRAQIARQLGVSPATVTQVTKQLIAAELIKELDTPARSTGGRPARQLALAAAPSAATSPGALGVKVSESHVNVVVVDLAGTVRWAREYPFRSSAPDALDRLAALLQEALESHRTHGGGTILGVGVGLPGSVDAQANGAVAAPTLGWADAQVGAVLRSALGLPVLVENDVNALAVAESLYGVGQRHSSYMVVTIGRGIGCGIVIDGAIYRGAGGGAGEIGHVPVSDDGPPCGCGNTGCLEAYVGEDGLVTAALTSGAIGPDGTMSDLVSAALSGDHAAAGVFHEAGRILGRTLAGVVHTVDPEVIVLLGEGIQAWPYWQRGFEETFRARLMPSRRSLPYLTEAWDDNQWAQGAAALVLSSPFDQAGATGEAGRQVRERLHTAPGH